MEKGDVVLVNFPFSDLSYTKRRPALVLNNLEGEEIVLCSITTKKGKFEKYIIKLNMNTVQNLTVDSFIKVDKLFSLKKNLIIKKIGHIESDEIIKDLDQKLCLLFKIRIS